MSSRLFTEVREKRGLCYAISASLNSLKDQARVLCYAGTTTERAQETLDVTVRELEILGGTGHEIGEDELERCKARAKSSLVMQQESTISRSSSIARDWFHLGRVETLSEVRDKINALTVETITDYVHQHPARDFTILTIGPQALEEPRGVS
jgi:predicted Zn-dependent peptidase